VTVVVITGGSAGVGRATARAFAEEGAAVGVIARGRERLERTAHEIEARGGRAAWVTADVADEEAVETAADTFERELGPIDVWVNNAMATIFAPLAEISAAEYRRATDVTYLGSVWGTLAALRRMRPRDRGVVVQVGSALAYRGIPLQSPYCGAKHALQGFLESVRTELLHEGSRVRLTMVQLPALNTPQFSWVRSRLPSHPRPVPPIYQPEVAAEAILWAARHPRRQLLVGWPTVKAVLGNAVAPGYADRVLARTGISAQQFETRVSTQRPDNLYEPVPGVWEAHGIFDDDARTRSVQLWATTHRGTLAVAASVLAGALVARARR
jgi:NAD(P)-dependent dehydrogenase (short-subunit alcohol dehydrogenase family)